VQAPASLVFHGNLLRARRGPCLFWRAALRMVRRTLVGPPPGADVVAGIAPTLRVRPQDCLPLEQKPCQQSERRGHLLYASPCARARASWEPMSCADILSHARDKVSCSDSETSPNIRDAAVPRGGSPACRHLCRTGDTTTGVDARRSCNPPPAL